MPDYAHFDAVVFDNNFWKEWKFQIEFLLILINFKTECVRWGIMLTYMVTSKKNTDETC